MSKSEFYNHVIKHCRALGRYDCDDPPMSIILLDGFWQPWCIEHKGKLNRGNEYYDTVEEAVSDLVELVYGDKNEKVF